MVKDLVLHALLRYKTEGFSQLKEKIHANLPRFNRSVSVKTFPEGERGNGCVGEHRRIIRKVTFDQESGKAY